MNLAQPSASGPLRRAPRTGQGGLDDVDMRARDGTAVGVQDAHGQRAVGRHATRREDHALRAGEDAVDAAQDAGRGHRGARALRRGVAVEHDVHGAVPVTASENRPSGSVRAVATGRRPERQDELPRPGPVRRDRGASRSRGADAPGDEGHSEGPDGRPPAPRERGRPGVEREGRRDLDRLQGHLEDDLAGGVGAGPGAGARRRRR